ncbi:hypothetical protein M426DRAFT_7194 [Hypoxylon sp. CI-4A]|nr:hypothetical protein M426DRAFT_7194 [Hypoxylon sp. CI-4A]
MGTQPPFRVIIVGGGMVGLTAAHIFSQAGIEFLILEKHETPLYSQGSTLAIWPQTFRIFDQLGLLRVVHPILDCINVALILSTKDGRVRIRDDTFQLIKHNHGHGLEIAHRPDIVKVLYESLPETAKDRIILKKCVTNTAVSDDGVTVACADGSTYQGSIVIGADGVHSRVRLLARALQAGKKPEDLPQDQISPYTTTYRMYHGALPILPGLTRNTRYDGTGDGVTTQLINGRDRSWFAIYEKLDSPASKSTRYTEADKMDVTKKWCHLYMAPNWTVHDVHAHRIGEDGLIDLEEGLIDEWSFQRVVMVGDAVHKLEPHSGLGYNCGVADLVVLTNELRHMLQRDNTPSTQDLETLFQAYQAKRAKDTQMMTELAMKTPRSLAWLTWRQKFMAKYVLPYFPVQKMHINGSVGPLVSKMPVLDWLEEKALPSSGIIPWKYHPASRDEMAIDI